MIFLQKILFFIFTKKRHVHIPATTSNNCLFIFHLSISLSYDAVSFFMRLLSFEDLFQKQLFKKLTETVRSNIITVCYFGIQSLYMDFIHQCLRLTFSLCASRLDRYKSLEFIHQCLRLTFNF